MTITYHPELVQGSDEWIAARLGLITAGSMNLLLTPKKLEYAKNEKERAHLFELLAQRVNNYIEPQYIGDDMLRGLNDEVDARILYGEKYAPTTECGFVTNDKFGFVIGYSPDALVGDDGLVECKSRAQKYQVQTIIEGVLPDEYRLQIQTGLLVTERKWCDFVSYCGGMPMFVLRVIPDPQIQAIILEAARAFNGRLAEATAIYQRAIVGLHPTERKTYDEEIKT
jgi:hypothetical protein